MSVSKTSDLLDQISTLEKTFNEFSFEELNVEEAKSLQASFNEFRKGLESHIYEPTTNSTIPKRELQDIGRSVQEREDRNIIAHVSHEMRTPLNGIMGFANLLEDDDLNSSQLKKVQAIQVASNSLLKIINELLEFSKVSSDNQNFESIDFNLESVVNDIMFLSETLIMDRKIKLNLYLDAHIPKIINGDPSKLSQVLLNFLGNSIKFVEDGKIELDISVIELTKEKCLLKFKVVDTGIGIPKDMLSTIFDSYTQGKEETYDKYGGTGLGLTISKQIIEKQGGSIHLDSVEGIGTTITFTLPFSTGNSFTVPQKKRNTVNIQKGKELLNGTNILVFEDNLMNKQLIIEQLRKWGCNIYAVENLEQGAELLSAKSIDIVFMDLKMPIMNGIDTIKAIRKNKNIAISEVPIVAFSADFSEQEKNECNRLRVKDFLLKPYTLDELLFSIVKNKRKPKYAPTNTNLLKKEMIQKMGTTQLNLSAVLRDCFDDIEMLEELVRLFKLNVVEFTDNVKHALENKDLNSIALSAHKLKAGMAMLKANGMKDVILNIEQESKQTNIENVKRLYSLFINDYPVLEENIDTELRKLKASNS